MQRLGYFAVLMAIITTGCGAGWKQREYMAPGTWPPRQQVQVWSGDSAIRWHEVVIRSDSITGSPFRRPLHCDSCRVSLPLAGVDSVRVGNPVAGFWKTFALVVGLPMAWFIFFCHGGACFNHT